MTFPEVLVTIIDSYTHAGHSWLEPIDLLLYQMEANGIDKAVLVQHRGVYDNTYLFDCAKQHPGKFAVVVRVDTDEPNAAEVLEGWARQGAVGISTSPTMRSPGADPLAIWRKAAELGLVVICQGDVTHFASDDFEALLRDVPGLTVVIEHLAGVGPNGQPPYAEYKKVLTLAKYSTVYMETGGLGETTPRPPVLKPSFDIGNVAPYLEMALEAFGHQRVMWGSDYPPVSVREGYHNALHRVMDHPALADPEVKDWVMNRTAAALFKLG
jgi:L-fuconolactonase